MFSPREAIAVRSRYGMQTIFANPSFGIGTQLGLAPITTSQTTSGLTQAASSREWNCKISMLATGSIEQLAIDLAYESTT
jgi:hypothetical protein